MPFENLAQRANRLYGQIVKIPRSRTEEEQLLDSIKKARTDLERAESLFNEITSAEMVDYLSYDIMAAKSRYSHLLRVARERNIRI